MEESISINNEKDQEKQKLSQTQRIDLGNTSLAAVASSNNHNNNIHKATS